MLIVHRPRSSTKGKSLETISCAVGVIYNAIFQLNILAGFRCEPTPTAVLHKWYSLVREKRQTRLDFIRTITKCFDVDSTKLSATQEDIDFVRYMAENFSAFEYKTQEEVLAVIRAITNVLAVSGMQLMEILSPSGLMAQLQSTPSEVGQTSQYYTYC